MRYYGTSKEGKKDYILGVEGNEDSTGARSLEVTFADKRKFENLEYTPLTVFEAGLNDTYTVAILSANGSLGNAKPLKLLNEFLQF